MTACAIETAAPAGAVRGAECTIAADGSYAARLARDGESWFPERWTLGGPEPYAVPLAGNQPEEAGTELLPLADGQVLIHRPTDGDQHLFSLLYPTGAATGPATGRETGERPLGAVECENLTLLPPSPAGSRAYALAVGEKSTAVWMVAGGTFGPEHVAEIPGVCSGGVWLDRTGRLLALDRREDGLTKTVVVDLERSGETTLLLDIAESSNDRLLLADPDSGLLLIRSDAPGEDRLGWGVLGSALPVRFPECLRPAELELTPFAIQPGQMLMPESCGVALRIDGPYGTWVGVWRPVERQLHQSPAPDGWLTGTGLWTAEGELQLPYATRSVPCGVARVSPPDPVARTVSVQVTAEPEPATPPRPVPLQQAPLTGRTTGG